MGLLVDGVWRDEQHTERTKGGSFPAPVHALPQLGDGGRQPPAPAAKAALPPRAGAIISMWRTPARGRTAR